VWTIWLKVGEAGFTSITASASGFEKSGLSNKVYAKLSGGASIASFGDAWKVGSGLIVISVPPCVPGALLAVYRFAERISERVSVAQKNSSRFSANTLRLDVAAPYSRTAWESARMSAVSSASLVG